MSIASSSSTRKKTSMKSITTDYETQTFFCSLPLCGSAGAGEVLSDKLKENLSTIVQVSCVYYKKCCYILIYRIGRLGK